MTCILHQLLIYLMSAAAVVALPAVRAGGGPGAAGEAAAVAVLPAVALVVVGEVAEQVRVLHAGRDRSLYSLRLSYTPTDGLALRPGHDVLEPGDQAVIPVAVLPHHHLLAVAGGRGRLADRLLHLSSITSKSNPHILIAVTSFSSMLF